MGQPGRYPGRLLGGQEIVRGICLDFDRPLEGVFELVEVVSVPAGDQIGTVVGKCARQHRAVATQVDEVPGRLGQILGRIGRDGHRVRVY